MRAGDDGVGIARPELLFREKDPILRKVVEDRFVSFVPHPPEPGKTVLQGRGSCIDEIPQNVDLRSLPDTGHFHTGDQFDAGMVRCRNGFRETGNRVVICESDGGKLLFCRIVNKLPGREGTVRSCGMYVKIDHLSSSRSIYRNVKLL